MNKGCGLGTGTRQVRPIIIGIGWINDLISRSEINKIALLGRKEVWCTVYFNIFAVFLLAIIAQFFCNFPQYSRLPLFPSATLL
jgi:hypothetical protein